MINQNYSFHIFLNTNRASKKAFNLKFENVSFTKFPKKHINDKICY